MVDCCEITMLLPRPSLSACLVASTSINQGEPRKNPKSRVPFTSFAVKFHDVGTEIFYGIICLCLCMYV